MAPSEAGSATLALKRQPAGRGVLDDELAVEDQAAGACPAAATTSDPPRSWSNVPRRPPTLDHSRRPHHALDCDRSKTWRSSGGRTR